MSLALTFDLVDPNSPRSHTFAAERDRFIRLGNLPSSTLRLNAKGVSRVHAIVELHNNRAVIRDLGSVGGTFVNGLRIIDKPLTDGDVVRLGDAELRVRLNSAPPPVVAPESPSPVLLTQVSAPAPRPRPRPVIYRPPVGEERYDTQKLVTLMKKERNVSRFWVLCGAAILLALALLPAWTTFVGAF